MNPEQMKDALLPTKESCFGLACISCMNPNPHLVRCSACKRAKYCNKTCQKKNWKEHKTVCKIIQTYDQLCESLFGEFHPASGRMGVFQKFQKFQKMMESSQQYDFIREIAPMVQFPTHISDTAWKTAETLIAYSPSCSICHKTEYDNKGVNGHSQIERKLKRCPKCKCGWCCSEEHFAEYQPMHTEQICQTYVNSFKMERFLYNHTIQHGDRFMLVPDRVRSKPMVQFPKDWNEYFAIRLPVECSMRHKLPEEFFPASTVQLSQVVNCLYGMYEHDKNFFTAAQNLTLHVVGAAPQFELEGGGATCVWEEIMHCLPSVQKMDVVFIGPDSYNFEATEIECCPDCIEKGRTRRMAFHNVTYHELFKDKGRFTKPDFVVAFNTGMYEEFTDSWKESVNVMLDLNVPCLFTSYNKYEAESDFDVLVELNAHTLTAAPVQNPFPVDFPVIDVSGTDIFYQSNMYCICFRGRQ